MNGLITETMKPVNRLRGRERERERNGKNGKMDGIAIKWTREKRTCPVK